MTSDLFTMKKCFHFIILGDFFFLYKKIIEVEYSDLTSLGL